MEDKNTPRKIKLLLTIIDRGKGEELTEIYRENHVMYNMILLGKGTAKSEILDYLGLGRTDKDIIISVGDEDNIKILLGILRNKYKLYEPGNGIAFTIPISSVDSALALDYINSIIHGKKEWDNGWKIKWI